MACRKRRGIGEWMILIALLAATTSSALAQAPPNPPVSGGTVDASGNFDEETLKRRKMQDAALDKLEKFFDEVGDQKALTDLKMHRANGAIKFVDSTTKDEDASYYKGVISLPERFAENVSDSSVDSKKPQMKEHARMMQFELLARMGQTMVHEMNHAAHDTEQHRTLLGLVNPDKTKSAWDPWGSHFETIAYHEAMKRTDQWTKHLATKLHAKEGCTRENAQKLQAMSDAWNDYSTAILNRQSDATIRTHPQDATTSYWSDSRGKPCLMHVRKSEIKAQADRAKEIQSACELLAGMSLVLGRPVPRNASLEDLMDTLLKTVHTEEELEELVGKLSRAAVHLGFTKATNDPKLIEKRIKELHASGYPKLLNEYRSRRQRQKEGFAGAVQDLQEVKLRLTCSPQPAYFDPTAGKAVVTATASAEYLSEIRAELSSLVRNLTGQAPQIRIIDYWTGPDGEEKAAAWPEGRSQQFEMAKPDKYTISLRRVILVDISAAGGRQLPEGSPLKKRVELKASATVDVKTAEFPLQIAGRWSGTMMLLNVNVPGRDTTPEGCDFDKLKGMKIGLTFDLPNSTAGTMKVTITPPAGNGEPKHATFTYRNADGKFNASGDIDKARMQLGGKFVPVGKSWTIHGTWGAGIREGLTMTGSWAASNPNAK